ncbi:hypothetical protein IGI04_012159 [Brassica rapa subsp. trilocularis]|uniref:Transposase-associated domain-containing protein n=1 Tax=Brassica rapa subsp. trilocularis TaxID=1813537 RepID=A0ABQ7N560_BRACM|nr:hypothetical protein IGI04_012159 [Brassica rapa subsp. trilocularis]
MSFYFDSREWMDQMIDPQSNSVSEVFLGGINAFLQFACNQADYEERQTLLCPCARCKNVKQRDAKVVSRHLFLYGFKGNYYVWTSHGEKFYTAGESSGANHSTGEEEMWENPTWNAHEDHYQDNLETFMMLNCETFAPYERMFEEYMTLNVPDITPVAMQKAKDTKFADWCKDYVTCFIPYPRVRRQSVDDWWACAKIIPRGIRETPEIALTAWQDDRRDQVAESSLLRVETHVVDDVSDYDIAPVNPPNDEYVSDGDVEADPTICHAVFVALLKEFISVFLLLLTLSTEEKPKLSLDSRLTKRVVFSGFKSPIPSVTMNSPRVPPPMPPGATGPASMPPGATGPPSMPPGATGPASNRAASSSRSNSYPQMTLNAMLNSPARLAQPHLHPDKINGALWGNVYGLGSAQYREQAPSSRVPNSLARNLELEMRVGGLETSLQSVREDVSEVKQDVSEMKQEFASTRDAINQLLQMLRPPQAPTEQTYAQPQVPTPQP